MALGISDSRGEEQGIRLPIRCTEGEARGTAAERTCTTAINLYDAQLAAPLPRCFSGPGIHNTVARNRGIEQQH